MSRVVNIQSAATFSPSSFDSVNTNVSYNATTGSGLTVANSNTRAYFLSNSQANSETNIYYNFDCSSIPQNATINSLTCDVKAVISSSYFNTRIAQLCCGTTKKGSPVTITNTSINNTVNVQTITNGGTWTRQELNDAKILIQGIRGTSTNEFNISFYGATLTVNYSISGIVYEITSVSNTDLATIDPEGSQDAFDGDSKTFSIYTESIDDIFVTDNDVNVTNSLIKVSNVSDSITSVPLSNFVTGVSSNNANFYISSNSTGTTNLDDSIGHTAESPASQPSSNKWTYVKDGGQNTATGWIIFSFDFSSIPENAIIDSVEVKCYGAKESISSNAQYVSKIGLYAGTTLKSTEQEFTSTATTIMTISNPGTWTRSELQNAKLRHTVAYYGGWLGGVSWKVNYSIPQSYYKYELTNISADHNVVVSGIFIPPEEEPEKTYYSLTVSSINASTTPKKGTTRVESGTSQTILIYPSDPLLTLTTDNGVDISNRLIYHSGTSNPTYNVTGTANGASYGFTHNTQTGYYTSNNKGTSKSAALARIDFNLPADCLVTFKFINYAEATYDFGVFGNIDTALSTSYYAAGSGGATITDSSYKLACNTSSYNKSGEQTLTYEIPSGEHYIYVKYSKDDATDSNNDTLQWKIDNIEMLSAPEDSYYEYTINDINQQHSLIFIFGDVTYYTINSSVNGDGKIYPDGQFVVLPGDNYSATIIPTNTASTVSATDNGIDVTNSIEYKDAVIVKDGVSSTTVNYTYGLTNVGTSHTIVITIHNQQPKVWLKSSNSWIDVKAFINEDNRWVEITNIDGLFSGGTIYMMN